MVAGLFSMWTRHSGWFHHDIWVYAARDWTWDALIRPTDGHLALVGVGISKALLGVFEFDYLWWNLTRALVWTILVGWIITTLIRRGIDKRIVFSSGLLLIVSPLTLWMEGWYLAWMLAVAGATWLVFFIARTTHPSFGELGIGLAVATVVTLSTTLGAMLVGGIGFAALVKKRWRWLIPLGLPLVIYIAWLFMVRGFGTATTTIEWSRFPSTASHMFGATILGHVPNGRLTFLRPAFGLLLAAGIVLVVLLRRRFEAVAGFAAISVFALGTFAFRVSAGRTDGLALHYLLALSVIIGFWILLPETMNWSGRLRTMVATLIVVGLVPATYYQFTRANEREAATAAYRTRVESAANHVWQSEPFQPDAQVGSRGPLPAVWLTQWKDLMSVPTKPTGTQAEYGIGDVVATIDGIDGSNPSWMGPEISCSMVLDAPEVVVVDAESGFDITVLVEDGLGAISLPAGRWWIDPVDGIALVTEEATLCEHKMRERRPHHRIVY